MFLDVRSSAASPAALAVERRPRSQAGDRNRCRSPALIDGKRERAAASRCCEVIARAGDSRRQLGDDRRAGASRACRAPHRAAASRQSAALCESKLAEITSGLMAPTSMSADAAGRPTRPGPTASSSNRRRPSLLAVRVTVCGEPAAGTQPDRVHARPLDDRPDGRDAKTRPRPRRNDSVVRRRGAGP